MRKTNENCKRKFADIEMDQNKEENKEVDLLWNKIKSLENKIKEYQANQDLFLQDKEKLVKLYQGGYIDSDGEIIGQ